MDEQGVADRIEIAELLARYARGVDRKDWDLWRSVFTDDAHVDYRSAGGIEGGRDEVGDWLAKVFVHVDMSQHAVSNIECDIDGDRATVTAMFSNPMRYAGSDDLMFCGGWYHHQLVRTPDGWRSRDLREETAWMQNPPPGLKT